jgi:hypothetical protein
MAQYNENSNAAVTTLWEPMATQIISIVGEGGFNSLYARSLFLNQSTFPWLVAASPMPAKSDDRFANLIMSFAAQTPDQVCEAHSRLLITLTDILALLIGEPLTTRILQLAWGNDILISTGKEFNRE